MEEKNKEPGFQGYLIALKNKGATFTQDIAMESINEIFDHIRNVPIRPWAPLNLPLTVQLWIKLSDDFSRWVLRGNKAFLLFNTSTNIDRDCIWITPFNKGNLYKIKVTQQWHIVYYGPTVKLHATTLKDCIEYILNFNHGHLDTNKAKI